MGRQNSCYNHIVMIKGHLVSHVRGGKWTLYQLNNSFLQAWRGSLSLEVGQIRSVNITKGVCTNKLYCFIPAAVHLLISAYHNVLLYLSQSKLTTTYCSRSANYTLVSANFRNASMHFQTADTTLNPQRIQPVIVINVLASSYNLFAVFVRL